VKLVNTINLKFIFCKIVGSSPTGGNKMKKMKKINYYIISLCLVSPVYYSKISSSLLAFNDINSIASSSNEGFIWTALFGGNYWFNVNSNWCDVANPVCTLPIASVYLSLFLIISSFFFIVLVKRNYYVVMLGIELLFLGIFLLYALVSFLVLNFSGFVYIFFIVILVGSEATFGLTLIYIIYKK
jgi:NADH:ubiquinone oxidoreductase subunit K